MCVAMAPVTLHFLEGDEKCFVAAFPLCAFTDGCAFVVHTAAHALIHQAEDYTWLSYCRVPRFYVINPRSFWLLS